MRAMRLSGVLEGGLVCLSLTVASSFAQTSPGPVMTIGYPSSGALFYTPANLHLQAGGYALNGSIQTVEFFANGKSLGLASLLPPGPPMPGGPPSSAFGLIWSNAPTGTNIALTVKATDSAGVSSTSASVPITIARGPAPPPPDPDPVVLTSLQVFGDGLCSTTTTSNQPTALYYGNRYCNGRVWMEVLAQRQGLPFYSSNNSSYFGHDSPTLVAELSHYSAPSDSNTALFVVWVCDADFVWDMFNVYPSLDLTTWNNYVNRSLANHWQVITNLYGKGARVFLLPNAVDITEVPEFSGMPASDKWFIRQRVVSFNAGLTALVAQAQASLPGITIYAPDYFSLLDDMLAHPANYGLINPPGSGDATEDGYTSLSDAPGANYIFWDWLNPTAHAQEVMADVAQQLISPAKLTNLTLLNGKNQLDVTSLPIGLSGFVEGRADPSQGIWAPVTSFNSTSAQQSLVVPASGAPQFYRLRFPFAWTWP
jgi:hypothetical protein